MTTPSNDLFEVYHYCTPEDQIAGRRTPNGFYETMEEAEWWLERFRRLASIRGSNAAYYLAQYDMDNVLEFMREHP